MSLIDLHTHSCAGSSDSSILPDDLVAQARQVGLEGVCITEHGNQRLPAELIEELGTRHGFLVIAGLEASTDEGHILIYGVESYPATLFRARDIRDYVAPRGGILVVAHPFRYLPKPWLAPPQARRTLRQAVVRDVFSLVTAMETDNGYADDAEITFSREVATARKLPGTGGSDAHATHEVGRCATLFRDTIRDETDFLEALRSGHYHGEDRRALIESGLVAAFNIINASA
jgi:predicted metal-dependent phosphoesterase TrpH